MSALPVEPTRVPTIDEIREMLPAGDSAAFQRELDAATPESIGSVADKWWGFAELFRRPGFAEVAEGAW